MLLSVRISDSSFIKFAVDETIIQEIPEYAGILQSVKTQSTGDKRLQITDSKIRHEESITRVIEFLTSGKLAPIDLSSPRASLGSLYELIDLYDLSVALKLLKLERVIKEHINDCDDLDLATFVRFATECYNSDTGHRVNEGSVLGRYIKLTISQYLRTLVETGIAEDIKNTGGTLSKQLTEVLMNYYTLTTKL